MSLLLMLLTTSPQEKKSTKHKTYNKKGILIAEGKYKDDLKEGLWINYWDRNGEIKSKVKYKKGKIHGTVIFYYYKFNKVYPDNLKGIQSIAKYKNGFRNGIFKEYRPDGTLYVKAFYKEGEKQGRWLYFRPDGSLGKIKSYYKDKKHGIWEYYENNGFLIQRREYRNGVREGEWLNYDDFFESYDKTVYKNGVIVKGHWGIVDMD